MQNDTGSSFLQSTCWHMPQSQSDVELQTLCPRPRGHAEA